MYCVCLTARMAKEKEKETRGEATETRLTLQHETAVVLMAEEERRRRRSASSSSSSSLLPRSSRSLHSTKTYSNTRKTGRHTETL